MNVIGLRHAVPIMLKATDVEYLDFLANGLSAQRNASVSRSEAVEFLIDRHKVKLQKQIVEKRHDRKVAEKRARDGNGVTSKLIRRG